DRTWSIHVSRSVQESIARVEFVSERLRQEFGRWPSVAEVAAVADMSIEDVTEARLAAGASRLTSLDAPVSREEDGRLAETLGRDDANLARVEDALWIDQLPDGLTDRQREVLRLRFVED